MKMRSLKLIIKSDGHKVMAKYGFGCRFHAIKFLKLDFVFVLLEFVINLRAPLQNFAENINLM